MNNNAVELFNLSHRFVKTWALANINLNIKKGEVIAVLGPNGCGKSTLLKILATLLEPTTGEGTILGYPLKQRPVMLRNRIEWLGHELGLYKILTAQENLEFASKLKGKNPPTSKISDALEEVGLGSYKTKAVQSFSIGMRKRLALARILLEEPELILLDEPHTNLDKEGRSLMNTLMIQWKNEERTILFSSHEHSETLNLCDKMLVLDQGKVNHFGKPL